jgi:hypothetical protein
VGTFSSSSFLYHMKIGALSLGDCVEGYVRRMQQAGSYLNLRLYWEWGEGRGRQAVRVRAVLHLVPQGWLEEEV